MWIHVPLSIYTWGFTFTMPLQSTLLHTLGHLQRARWQGTRIYLKGSAVGPAGNRSQKARSKHCGQTCLPLLSIGHVEHASDLNTEFLAQDPKSTSSC